jgi:hypothetical protein
MPGPTPNEVNEQMLAAQPSNSLAITTQNGAAGSTRQNVAQPSLRELTPAPTPRLDSNPQVFGSTIRSSARRPEGRTRHAATRAALHHQSCGSRLDRGCLSQAGRAARCCFSCAVRLASCLSCCRRCVACRACARLVGSSLVQLQGCCCLLLRPKHAKVVVRSSVRRPQARLKPVVQRLVHRDARPAGHEPARARVQQRQVPPVSSSTGRQPQQLPQRTQQALTTSSNATHVPLTLMWLRSALTAALRPSAASSSASSPS